MPLKPKPFDMSNPNPEIHITIDPKHCDFIVSLPYINQIRNWITDNEFVVWIDERYDIDDAWLDLYEQLTDETSKVELDSRWDIELDDVPPETK